DGQGCREGGPACCPERCPECGTTLGEGTGETDVQTVRIRAALVADGKSVHGPSDPADHPVCAGTPVRRPVAEPDPADPDPPPPAQNPPGAGAQSPPQLAENGSGTPPHRNEAVRGGEAAARRRAAAGGRFRRTSR